MGERELRRETACSGTISLLLSYKLVLDIVYIRYIYMMHVDHGWWNGPYDADLSVGGYLTAWLALGVILVLFRATLQKPLEEYRYSEYILFFLLIFSVIPGLAMCGAGAFAWEYRGLFCLYWFLFFLLTKGTSFQVQGLLKEWLQPQTKRHVLFAVGAIAAVTTVFVFFYYMGGDFFLFSLRSAEVYVRRRQFSEISLMFPLNYVMANAAVVFLFLVLFFFEKRRYVWAGLVLLAWYMEFSCGASKISVFSMLAGIFAYVFRHWLTKKSVLYSAIAFALAGIGAVWLGKGQLVLDWLRRMSFTTNLLSYCYYDFFQYHVPMLYRVFWGATFDRDAIPFMIGSQYWGNPMTHANNGLIGDSFMMAGVYGVILSPVLWSVYLYILDATGSRLAWWIKFGTSVYWVTIMQNGSFMTSMFSHGGMAMIVLAYLCSEGMDAGQVECRT